MRLLLRLAAALIALWIAFVGVVYSWMRTPPDDFAAHIAKLPGPAMMAVPFQTLWSSARAGTLNPGDSAPDFDLETVDKQSRIRLSAYRGSRPVVLIFGSYT